MASSFIIKKDDHHIFNIFQHRNINTLNVPPGMFGHLNVQQKFGILYILYFYFFFIFLQTVGTTISADEFMIPLDSISYHI